MGTPFFSCTGLAHARQPEIPIPTTKEPANAEPEELFTGYGDDDWTARVQSLGLSCAAWSPGLAPMSKSGQDAIYRPHQQCPVRLFH